MIDGLRDLFFVKEEYFKIIVEFIFCDGSMLLRDWYRM